MQAVGTTSVLAEPSSGPGGPALVVAADHDELEMARRLIKHNKCTVNLGSVALLHIVVGYLDRIDDDLAGLFSVPLMELSRDRGGGSRGRA